MASRKFYQIPLLALLVLACTGKQNNNVEEHDGHLHEHAGQVAREVPIFTVYADSLEIYFAGNPIVSGKQVELIAHFTDLRTFKPQEVDSIRLDVNFMGKRYTFSASQSHSPGLFELQVQFPENGEANAVVEIFVDGKKGSYDLGQFTIYHCEDDYAEAVEHANESNSINFSKEQAWAVDFATECILPQPIEQVVHATGRVLPAQSDELVLVAGISGIVTFTRKSILPGARVGKGQVLLQITSKGLADDNFSLRFTEAKSRYELAKSVYERQQQLASSQVISTAELEKSKNEYEVALSAYKTMENGYSSDGQQVVSPVNADVLTTFVSNGEYVSAGQPLVKLNKLAEYQIQCLVQPRYLNLMGSITDANIKLSSGQTINLNAIGGKIEAVGRTISADNHLLPVTLSVPESAGIPVGDVVEVFLIGKPVSNALTVPEGALLEEQGNYYVMVQLTPEMFVKREVQLGVNNGNRVEVKSGLEPGNRVVVKGAVYVKMAQSAGALDAHSGHVH